jgi:alcohol dehydrogenase class IV
MQSWNFPTPIRFGPSAINSLPEACEELGIERPLLVTDPGLARLPIVTQALNIARAAGLPAAIFADLQPNPVGRNVEAGVAALRAGEHDGVIAMGGGSSLDVAKAVALMAHQTRPLWDFEDREDWWTRVDVGAMVPVVAIPTTSGTGSEVGRCSVIIDEDVGIKKLIFHPEMTPGRVIADPELTLGLPPKLTAAVGMDALSHNLESYCVDSYHPMADGIALEGMRLVHRSLRAAVANGANLDARVEMMAASTMGATAFQKGLGAMHALANPIGAVHHTHHGLTNAVLMPYVLGFNRTAIQEKMQRMARYLGLPGEGFEAVLSWVLELRAEIGIPHTLTDIGIHPEHVEALVPLAVADPSAGGNPIPLTAEKVKSLFEAALSGKIPAG